MGEIPKQVDYPAPCRRDIYWLVSRLGPRTPVQLFWSGGFARLSANRYKQQAEDTLCGVAIKSDLCNFEPIVGVNWALLKNPSQIEFEQQSGWILASSI